MSSRPECRVPRCDRSAKPGEDRCWRHVKREPMDRKTRVKPTNPKRRARNFVRNYGSAEHVEAVKSEGCLVWRHNLQFGAQLAAMAGCHDTILDAAHARAKGMGGAKGDVEDLVCLCRTHHEEAGEFRTSQRDAFEAHYGVDLQEEARRVAEKRRAGDPWESLPY